MTPEEYSTMVQLLNTDQGMPIKEFYNRKSNDLLKKKLVRLSNERVYLTPEGFEALYEEEHEDGEDF